MTFALFNVWVFILFARPQDLILSLAPLRPAVVWGVVTVAVVMFASGQRLVESFSSTPEARKYLVFFGILVFGIPFAHHRGVAFDFMFKYVSNVLFFLVFVTIVNSVARVKQILWVFTLCAMFWGVFGLLEGAFSSGRFKIYGAMFDPNDIAYVLVSLLPLTLFFALRPGGLLKKVCSMIAAGTGIIVILLTASRAGLLGLTAVLVLALFTGGGSINTKHKLVLVAGIVLAVSLNMEHVNFGRYLTLMDLENDYNVTSESGRLDVWEKAYDLLLTYPLTGVGADCFAMAIGYLRAEAGLPPLWQAAHNSYLQVAAETGLAGFAVYVALITGCLRNFSRCRRIGRDGPAAIDRTDFTMAASLARLSYVGHLICAFFLSQGYSLFFTLFFALSAAMRRVSDLSLVTKEARSAPDPSYVPEGTAKAGTIATHLTRA